jgi:hypothetical protein
MIGLCGGVTGVRWQPCQAKTNIPSPDVPCAASRVRASRVPPMCHAPVLPFSVCLIVPVHVRVSAEVRVRVAVQPPLVAADEHRPRPRRRKVEALGQVARCPTRQGAQGAPAPDHPWRQPRYLPCVEWSPGVPCDMGGGGGGITQGSWWGQLGGFPSHTKPGKALVPWFPGLPVAPTIQVFQVVCGIINSRREVFDRDYLPSDVRGRCRRCRPQERWWAGQASTHVEAVLCCAPLPLPRDTHAPHFRIHQTMR